MKTLHLGKSNGRSPLQCGLPRVQRIWIIRGFILITLALACFALTPGPNALAISPAPDGGYVGWNTAEGQDALFHLTSGGFNTAVGAQALYANFTGSANTAVGAFALAAGNQNVAVGQGALRNNVADGNVAVGYQALHTNGNASRNTATGAQALYSNAYWGILNTGNDNTANGYQALYSNNGAGNNTATGSGALYHNTTGNFNTADGYQALYSNTTGGGSPPYDTRGNTAIGYSALYNNTTGSGNTALGNGAGSYVTTANGVISIGAAGANVDNSCYIGHVSGADATGGDPVFITGAGKLGTVNIPSSARFKEEIKPMNEASEVILALKPVTFRYKKEFDPKRIPQFGLVAEEVEKVNPDLVKHDRDGKLQTVRYDAVNAMLLNEFLKEHGKVEKQETTISQLRSTVAQQQKDFQATVAQLTARLDEQTSQIQKVSAQIEVNRQVPQIVSSNQ